MEKIRSYKTTLSGVGVILATLGNAISQYSELGFAGIDIATILAGVSTGIGLIVAKDFNVSGKKK